MCVGSCIDKLKNIVEHGGLVLDDSGEIYTEYIKYLSLRGQPGVGDIFIKWVHNNQWNMAKVDRITITKVDTSYREFPSDQRFKGFDRTDKKFIAVSNGHPNKPPILQATDSKWWLYKDAFIQCGVSVCFLCEDYVQAKSTRRGR